MQTGNLCILKGLLGSKSEIMKDQDEKISRNSISTLLVKINKHERIVKNIKTGCNINVTGKINIVKNKHQHIHIDEISIIDSQ